MGLIIIGHQLEVRRPTFEDIEKEQGMPGGFKESSCKGTGCESVTLQWREGSNGHQRFQEQTEAVDSVEKGPQYKADEEGFDNEQDEATRTPPVPTGSTGDSSSEES